MTADVFPGGVLLGPYEADIIDQALFVAVHQRRPSAGGDPSAATRNRDLFDELRRVRATEPPSAACASHRPAVEGVRLRRGRVDRVQISGIAWVVARAALLVACFDDTLCEHDFGAVVGWRRSDFHALAAECEVMDAESLRAELFRARTLEDGVLHRKLLTFALDHMGMEPTGRDREAVARNLSVAANPCEAAALTDVLARTRAKAGKAGRRSRMAGPGRRGPGTGR
ncbi:hypothetical protein [Streptomyces iconiensis]|uniref:Uncharacterized protein n=1 Tax=Streptomyces iconiensis TaxID=1384038 RepID=A0ABT7A3X8_9ACTN|nr:hypothetical protein [Streptomyces iconiensis]MDJ1136054.1 hypothetical protein [Streptomyces iconiensis]